MVNDEMVYHDDSSYVNKDQAQDQCRRSGFGSYPVGLHQKDDKLIVKVISVVSTCNSGWV